MKSKLIAALIASLVCCNLAAAETVVIPVTADTTISAAAADNTLGGHSQLLAGTDGAGRARRALLRFDVAGAIPEAAVVESATLFLTVNASNQHAAVFNLHRMLVDWEEGAGISSSGQPAGGGNTTWNNRRHPSTPWGAPGGLSGVDYFAAPSSSAAVLAAGEYAFANLAADVQGMLNSPASDFGWLLVSALEGTPTTGRQVDSREGFGTPPRLEVSYALVPEPSASILATAAAAAIIAARWNHARIRRARRRPTRSARC